FELDETELPEYGEEQALEDSQGTGELELNSEPEVEDEPSFELDDTELPEYGEEQALEDSQEAAEPEVSSEPKVEDEPSFALDETELPEYGEEQALEDSQEAEEPELSAEPEIEQQLEASSTQSEAPVRSGPQPVENYDEQTFNELLHDETPSKHSFDFNRPMDDEVSDSAGMNLDAMLEVGGEDWNGFNLSPEQQAEISDDIPEEEQNIWSDAELEQPEVQDEDWGEQDNLPSEEPAQPAYRTIDELMAEVEQDEQGALDDDELKLDVGLTDFPDVIGDIGNFEDIDANSEAAGKLDLAKIYIEMNDSKGAIKLLEEAIVDGSDEIRREAKNLIDAIYGR
ncbi:FimV C-terminal domain-containing protein, partial [Vibrio xiamenensis]